MRSNQPDLIMYAYMKGREIETFSEKKRKTKRSAMFK